MGILSEVLIVRLADSETFIGHCWASGDGRFEAFWYEGTERTTMFFDCNGIQQGAWKKYRLKFKG